MANANPDDGGKAAPAEVDLEEALAALTPELLSKLEMTINADGSVTFIDFPPELMDIAYALNPDDPLVCERRALVEGVKPPDE
jgi:hypothetical protein